MQILSRIKSFCCWFFSPSQKEMICDDSNLYDKLMELEDRIRKLEEENIGTSNVLYEIENRIDTIVYRHEGEEYNREY